GLPNGSRLSRGLRPPRADSFKRWLGRARFKPRWLRTRAPPVERDRPPDPEPAPPRPADPPPPMDHRREAGRHTVPRAARQWGGTPPRTPRRQSARSPPTSRAAG